METMYRNKGMKAIQIFIDYERLENRLPTKKEFDKAWYGRELPHNRSNYYYKVKKQFEEWKKEEVINNDV